MDNVAARPRRRRRRRGARRRGAAHRRGPARPRRWRGGWAPSTTRSRARSTARVPRGTTATGWRCDRDAARGAGRRARVARRRRRCATACSGRRRPTSTSSSTATCAAAARSLGRGAGGASFELSDQFGAWRVVAPRPQLAGRHHAAAGRLAGGRPRRARPHGQRDGRAAGRRRARRPPRRRARTSTAGACGWSAPTPSPPIPLRTLRVARLATELGFEVDPDDRGGGRAHAPGLAGAAQERVFAELKRDRRRRRGGRAASR